MVNWLWRFLAVVAGYYLVRHLGLILDGGPRGDLDIIITAAKRFMAHEPVYLLTDDSEHTKPPLLMGLVFVLAQLPEGWVHAVWDVVNLCLPLLILKECFPSSLSPLQWRPIALMWVLMYPFWYKEAGYGQYNLFMLLLVLIAARRLLRGGPIGQGVAGALAAFTLVLKPTQLYLMPWLALHAFAGERPGRRWFHFTGGGVLALAALSLSYCWLRSPAELVTDHLEWARFLPQSAAKNILRADNYGLPTLLTRMGWGEFVSGPLFLPISLLVTVLGVYRLRDEPTLARDWSLLLLLAFSQMTWRANFGLLLPAAYLLATVFVSGQALQKKWAAAGLLMILVVSKDSPYWWGPGFNRSFGLWLGPLWLMGGAVYCRHRLSRSLKAEV